MKLDKLYKEITEANGIAGHEHNVYSIMEREIKKHNKNIEKDKLGSLISKKIGDKKNNKTTFFVSFRLNFFQGQKKF